MKRTTISIFLFFIFYSSFCQLKHIELLIGQLDTHVISYFDSLNNLKSNPYYKIKKDVSDYGDMILSNEFSLSDESYYTCLSVTARFARIKGVELCDRQYISGTSEFSKLNLDFIKDNFKFVSEKNNWERIIVPDHYKIIASFEKRDSFIQ